MVSDVCCKFFYRNRKIDAVHLPGYHFFKFHVPYRRSKKLKFISFHIERDKKGDAVDMVIMRMGDEYFCRQRKLFLLQQMGRQSLDAGACIKDKIMFFCDTKGYTIGISAI